MTIQQFVKFYDDHLGYGVDELVKMLQEEGVKNYAGPNEYDEWAVKNELNDPNVTEHALTMKPENWSATDADGKSDRIIKGIICDLLFNKLKPEVREKFGTDVSKARSNIRGLLEVALKQRALEELGEELPEFIYRGIPEYEDTGAPYDVNAATDVFPLTDGFKGAFHPKNEGVNKMAVFVTTVPSVAASYARKDKFNRKGKYPTNYGDKIYRIRTQGLDPKLFHKDVGSTTDELLFGPQYRYDGPIDQEDLEIVDQAGNKRKVKRIEEEHYLSDALCKNVVWPSHLIDAVRRTI